MSVNLLSKLMLISLFGVKWSNYAMSVVCGVQHLDCYVKCLLSSQQPFEVHAVMAVALV